MIISGNFYTYLLVLLLIISFTLNPYLKKKASNKVKPTEFMIIYHIISSILIFGFFGYQIFKKQCDITCFKKLNKKDYGFTIVASITGVAGAILLLYLIKKDDVSFILPNVQGLVIALSALIGYFVFNENMNKLKIFGIMLIIFGVAIINYSKLKYKNI